jgi:archaellum biogenesis ATPase FlaH
MFNYWDADTVRMMAHVLNKNMCRPPLPDSEVDTIVKSIGKREIHPTPARSMEQRDWEHVEGKRDLREKPYRGILKPKGRFVPTGICNVDSAINDLAPGCVTLLTGRSNAGKTLIVKQIAARAIDYGNKVFIVSGEGDQEYFLNSLYQAVIGRDKWFYDEVKINKKWLKEPKAYVLNALRRWHDGKLTLFNNVESKFDTMDELFEMMNYEAETHEHNLIVIDNLMSILKAKATEKNEAQADFMQKCHDLAITHGIHILLVLHPNKEYRKGDEFDFEFISGTSDLYNKADNILVVIREYSPAKIAAGQSGKIIVLKNRYYSDLPTIDLSFDHETGLLLESYEGIPVSYEFEWLRYIDLDEAPAGVLNAVREAQDERQLREPGEE